MNFFSKGWKELLIWLLTTILSSVAVLVSNMSYLDQTRHFIWAQTYYKCYQQTTLEQDFVKRAYRKMIVLFLNQNLYCEYSKEPSQ